MKIQFITLIIAAFVVLSMQSCSHPECMGLGDGFIYLKGFDSVQLETVIVRNYPAGDNFIHLSDSTVYRLSAYTSGLLHDSSGHVIPPYSFGIRGGSETSVSIPGTGAVHYIKDIMSTHEKNKFYETGSDSKVCYNALIAYNLDGTVYTTGKSITYGDESPQGIAITP